MIAAVTTLGILLVVVCAVGGLVFEAGPPALLAELNKPLTRSIIRFTLWQAALSTLLSVGLAVPLARALARRGHFPGRRLILRLSSLSLIIPTMVAVLGVVAVHGRHGWINRLLAALGFEGFDYLYGLAGILIAHVFFNLPLATRIFLNGLLSVPRHSWNLAALYGMRPGHIFRHIEWPMLRGLIPGVAGMVFLLCFTSFAIVLTLGGGPKSTTLEVAVYQALRFDFDLSRAVALSLIQIGICLLLALAFFSFGAPFPLRPGDSPGISGISGISGTPDMERPDRAAKLPRLVDAVVITAASVFLLSPLAAVLVKTLTPGGWAILAEPVFGNALRWSLLIALCAGLLSCLLALAVCNVMVALRRSRRFVAWAVAPEIVGLLTLLVPPITLGAGLFLFFRRALDHGDVLSLGPLLVIVLNALLTLAFGVRILGPALLAQRNRYDPLCAGLGISGWNQWRHILWPALRRPVAYALAVATTLSAGDMGVIALFGTADLSTLPLLMYRLIGSYRLEQAAVVAVALCALCFALFWVIERLGRLGPSESGPSPGSGSETTKERRHA